MQNPYLEEAKRYLTLLENDITTDEPKAWLSVIAYALISIAESQADIAANSQYAP